MRVKRTLMKVDDEPRGIKHSISHLRGNPCACTRVIWPNKVQKYACGDATFCKGGLQPGHNLAKQRLNLRLHAVKAQPRLIGHLEPRNDVGERRALQAHDPRAERAHGVGADGEPRPRRAARRAVGARAAAARDGRRIVRGRRRGPE